MRTIAKKADIASLKTAKSIIRNRFLELLKAPDEVSIKRVSVKIEPVNVLKWLTSQKSDIKIYWHDRSNRFTVGAFGSVDYIKTDGIVDYGVITSKMENNLSGAAPLVRYYGGISFDSSGISDEWRSFGSARFVIPRFEVFKSGKGVFLSCNFSKRDSEAGVQKLLNDLVDNIDSDSGKNGGIMAPFVRKDEPSIKEWRALVNKSIDELKEKEYEKIVLARKSTFNFKKPLNGFYILGKLGKLADRSYIFAFQFKKGSMFIGASPERLFNRNKRTIETEAIAGTRPRGSKASMDRALIDELKKSVKDIDEHNIVKKMIKEKLAGICADVNTDSRTSVLTLRYGHHLFTPFKGKLMDKISDGAILKELHPTPAVSGYPVHLSKNIIKKKRPKYIKIF